MRSVVDIKGGYGNQLFCYSFGYAVSKETGSELIIDTSMLDMNNVKDRNYQLGVLGITYDSHISYKYGKDFLSRKTGLNRLRKKSAIGFGTVVFKEKEQYVYDPSVFEIKRDTYFDGFWQSSRYFEKYSDDLRKMLKPKKISDAAEKLAEEAKDCLSVSVHIRRGDYVSLGWTLKDDYYIKALDIIKERYGSEPVFFVFSDNKKYADDFFSAAGLEYRLMDYETEDAVRDDMFLMSRCSHNIMANSSYSWWGAFLNDNKDKTVICPETGVWGGDFYPEGWMKVTASSGK